MTPDWTGIRDHSLSPDSGKCSTWLHRKKNKKTTLTEEINGQRLRSEAGCNKLVSILVRWLREGLSGKASVDKVAWTGTVKAFHVLS